jgi:hypothetical protein
MAYQQTNIVAVTDIPDIVATFAQANGWVVNTATAGAPVFTHPSLAGALPMRLTATIGGTNNQNHDVIWEEANVSVSTSKAVCRSPKLAGSSNNPTVPSPTNLHLFVSLTPEPFIAGVIEYGFNLDRHFYFGYLCKAGVFDGGEVICGMAGPGAIFTNSDISYTDESSFKFLFEARHDSNILADADSGGVHVDHPNNPNPWRVINATDAPSPFGNFAGDEIIGGFGDGINDGYLARGNSSYAGSAILSPINMYMSKPITGDTLFTPVGSPAGVANVNMRDLEPGQQVTIGSDTWRVFPAAAKDARTVMSGNVANGYYRDYETSFYVGHAYLET